MSKSTDYTPLVSIVIPVYNGANYLSQAIESALNQTYPNIEILVINDGSTDNGATESVAFSYKDKIRYFSKPNGGVSSALNLGLAEMKGEWFSWLSHDDLYAPRKVARQMEQLQTVAHKEMAIVCCADNLIDKDGNKIFHPATPYSGCYSGSDMFRKFHAMRSNINGCTLLINKHLFSSYGGFLAFTYLQDTECWVRFMLNGASFYCIPDQLVSMRVHKEQVSVKFPELYYEERVEYGKIVADTLLKDANTNRDLINLFLAIQYKNHEISVANYITSHIINPYPFRRYLYWLQGSAYMMLRRVYHSVFKKAA